MVAEMKIIRLLLLSQMPILTMVFSGTLCAEDTNSAALSQKDLQAKLTYCETCHGLSAQGFRGYSVMPRLAGQQTEYLENQLRAFVERRRDSKFMFGVASALSPAMATALAAHFRDLNPKPLGGAPQDLVAAGKKLYEEGVPSANIQPRFTDSPKTAGPEARFRTTARKYLTPDEVEKLIKAARDNRHGHRD